MLYYKQQLLQINLCKLKTLKKKPYTHMRLLLEAPGCEDLTAQRYVTLKSEQVQRTIDNK